MYAALQVEALTALISSLSTRVEELVKKVEEMNKQNNEDVLYDLADLQRIFKVSSRTIYNWRAQNILPLSELGGKLYLTQRRLFEIIEKHPQLKKGGRHE